MNTTSRALLLILIFSSSVNIQASHTTTLINNSPFLPFAYKSQAEQNKVIHQAPKTNPSFILRGICKIGAQFEFSIHDSRTQKSKWIQAGEVTNGFRIISYDPVTNTIEYRWNNELNTLKLCSSDDQPIPLTFLDSPHSTAATSAVHGNSARHHNSNTGDRSRNTQSELNSHQSLEKIIFNNTTSYANRGDAYQNYHTSSNGDLFASSNLPSAGMSQLVSNEPARRFSIKRNNQVENPNGTTPDHER